MNIIWIVSDTLRRDHIGVYGNKTIHTPSIDALATKSVRFDRCYAASFPTMPTRADYFTGRFSASFMKWGPFSETDVTLAQILSKAGFHTAAIVDTPFYLRLGMNYDRGFYTFSVIEGQSLRRGEAHDVRAAWRFESDCCAPQTFIKATEWLERHYKEDFFLYIDAWDPHELWNAPNYYTELYMPDYDGEIVRPAYQYWQEVPGLTEEKVKKAHASYCGEVTMVDTWLGYFLRRLENMNLMEKTAIVFTSDHGFYFGEHGGIFGKMVLGKKSDGTPYKMSDPDGKWGHSPLYEEVTAIPLFIYIPGVSSAVYMGLTSAVDLMPTVLDIMGQKIPANVEGHSLLPTMKDINTKGREFVITTQPFANPGDFEGVVDNVDRATNVYTGVTVTTEEWSLLYEVEPGLSELYHLPSDRKQEKNVISKHPEVARELHQMLVKFMRETNVLPRFAEIRSELRL